MIRARSRAVVLAVALALVAGVASTGAAAPDSPVNIVLANDSRLRYVGHWGAVAETSRATVNSGARLLARFTGRRLTLLLGTEAMSAAPEVYVTVDGKRSGPHALTGHTFDVPVPAARPSHSFELAVKQVGVFGRWKQPFGSAVVIRGMVLEPGATLQARPAPAAVRMEFYGDSITEGTAALRPSGDDNTAADGTKAYPFLLGARFRADVNQVGFGYQGIFQAGVGDVPPATASFGWNFDGSRADAAFVPHVVVVNLGTGDSKTPNKDFTIGYQDYVRQIRRRSPNAWIFCMGPFYYPAHAADVAVAVHGLRDRRVVFVDTRGWLGGAKDFSDFVHPSVTGHARAAARLASVISRATGLRAY